MKRTRAILASIIGGIIIFSMLVLVLGGFIPTLTEIRMDRLRIGMTDTETADLLGQPTIVITNNDVVIWHYDTMRKNTDPYVIFNNEGKIKTFGRED